MATEKIVLYDCDGDITVEANISPADAERARRDIFFARQLVKTAVNEDSNADAENAQFHENFEFDDEEVPFHSEGVLKTENEESEDGVSLCRWSPSAVLVLLQAYTGMQEKMYNGTLTNKQAWKKIAQELNRNGHNFTAMQCGSKLRSLKKTYKATRNHLRNSKYRGNWQFYEQMDEIFGKKALGNPVDDASTGLLSKTPDGGDSTAESDSGCSSKARKPSVMTLLGKRLRQKEEHEKNRQKRHRERMEMDEKFLQVLQKLADKL